VQLTKSWKDFQHQPNATSKTEESIGCIYWNEGKAGSKLVPEHEDEPQSYCKGTQQGKSGCCISYEEGNKNKQRISEKQMSAWCLFVLYGIISGLHQ
jgi:hypothetical protein